MQTPSYTLVYWIFCIRRYNHADPDQGLGDGLRECHHVLQGYRYTLHTSDRHQDSVLGEGSDKRRDQRGRLQRVRPSAGRHHPEERPRHQEPRRYPLREGVHCSGDAGSGRIGKLER